MTRDVPERKMCVQAVRSTLFNATFNPDLLAVNLTAHFMSETFDGFAARARKAVRHPATEQGMLRLQSFVNARFYHALPAEIARINGLHERETLTDADDLEANDYAMSLLRERDRRVTASGGDVGGTHSYLVNAAFPKFVYPVADFIAASARRLGNSPSALGVTCCADECILIASLAVKLGLCSLDDVVILGSPVHYMLFLFAQDQTFWFNAKREFLTSEAWNARAGATAPEREEAFMAMVPDYDRIVTPRGSCIFRLGYSTLPPDLLVRNVERMSRFLGFERPDLRAAAEAPFPARVRPLAPEVERAMESGRSAADIDEIARLTAPADSVAAFARYANRSLDVPHPSVYVEAAMNSFRAFILAAQVSTTEDAVSIVRAVKGDASILSGGRRIALPDEVLYYEAADAAERALLLYTLLANSPAFDASARASLDISLQQDGAVVTFGDRSWNGPDLL